MEHMFFVFDPCFSFCIKPKFLGGEEEPTRDIKTYIRVITYSGVHCRKGLLI